jgi:hypothetical protein
MRHRLRSSQRAGLFDRVFALLVAREWIGPLAEGTRFETTASDDDDEEWPL